MKKFRFCFLVCIFAAFSWFPAQALQFEKLSDAPEAGEIYAQADKAVSWANDFLAHGSPASEPATVNDIDWEGAYKVYVDTSIFQLNTVSTQGVLDILAEQDSYLWQLPIRGKTDMVIVSFTKLKPVRSLPKEELTQAELAALRTKKGIWTVNSAGANDTTLRIRLEEAASANHLNEEDQHGILIGGESGIHYTMIGLVANETEITHFIPLDTDIVMDTASRRPIYFAEKKAYSLREWQPVLSKILPDPPRVMPPVVVGIFVLVPMIIVICLSVFSLYHVRNRRKEGQS